MAKKAVLVVEDDPLLRSDAATLLEEAGLDVVAFETADDALAFVFEQAEHVAAIFTDVEMPGDTDGLELAQTVEKAWPGIVVVVTSGRIRPPAGFPTNVRFVPKPWRPLDVLTAMQDAVH